MRDGDIRYGEIHPMPADRQIRCECGQLATHYQERGIVCCSLFAAEPATVPYTHLPLCGRCVPNDMPHIQRVT